MELDTNEALLRWMEDQGLSPFTLLKLTPKPTAKAKKLPASVVMEWGLEDLEHEGEREKFLAWRVTAEEIEVFRGEGALDPFEECHTELGEEAGIDLRLEAGGTLTLRCARLVVGEPVARWRKGRPRPHHGEANLELDLSTATWGKLRRWLGVPPELSCLRHREPGSFDDGATPQRSEHAMLADGAGHDLLWLSFHSENRFTVSRGKWAPDELWTTVWSKLTSVPGVTCISSRDLVCPPGTWPESPPPKPAPQVWPNVFGAACELAAMTLDDLRQCLGLPSALPFVFEDEEALEPRPTLTLGEAARHEGSEASGAFHDASGKPLVSVRADLRESVLSFTRERACDDATWLAVWRGSARLPGLSERHSRTTQSPPDSWPAAPPKR